MLQLKGAHAVTCKKSIAEFVEGKEYEIYLQRMTGKMYKPGFTIVNGKQVWNDKIGEPENKIMVIGSGVFCCRTKEVLDEHFESKD